MRRGATFTASVLFSFSFKGDSSTLSLTRHISTSVFFSSLPLDFHLKLNFTSSVRSQRNNLTGSGALTCRLEVLVGCFHIKLLSTGSGVACV